MSIKPGRLAAFAGAAILCFGIPAFGQAVNGQSASMSLTNVNGDPIVTVGGEEVYAGVYGGTSNLPGANTGIICDDFYDEVGVPDSWAATAYKASTLTAATGAKLTATTTPISDVLFGGNSTGYTNIGIAGYAAIAYLANLSFESSGNPTLQGNISEAIWSISDPAIAGTIDSAAQTLVTQAEAYAQKTNDSMSQYTNLWIYTPSPMIGSGEPQEMWGTVPEGGAAFMYLLLAGIACFGAMRFSPRRQSGRRQAF
jgi:hypothetical protein